MLAHHLENTMSNENKGLPLRDESKPAEQQGMFRKFDVYRYDGEHRQGGKHHGCRYFVLDLTHDQHAPAAMRAYASDCRATHPVLADDIEAEHGAATLALPDLNDDLRDILGRPNFTCITIAQRLREMGHSIKHRAEYEQAAVIHLLLSHYLKHGAAWRDTVQAFLSGAVPDPAQDTAAAPVISSDHGPDEGTPETAAHQPSGVPR
jgi:hypothetical protein